MKKNLNLNSFVAIFAALTLFACTQEEMSNLPVQAEVDVVAMKELPKYRTYEEALAVAQDAIGMLGENSTTRSGRPRRVNTDDVQYIVSASATRSSAAPDTLMYVFNYDDNAGFAVVSANRATEELIAVAEQGSYSVDEKTDNEGFNLYMDMAEAYVMDADSFPRVEFPEYGDDVLVDFRGSTTRDTTTYGPYINVRWGQRYPYYNSTPTINDEHTPAGCVATAIAQIMSFHNHPQSINVTFESPNYLLPLDWNSIKQHQQSLHQYVNTCYGSCFYQHTTIGKLFRQIGTYVSMDYKLKGSGADSQNVPTALSKLGYSSSNFIDYNTNTVRANLISRKPVYMRGEGLDENEKMVGHAWVIDGLQDIHVERRDSTRVVGTLLWEVEVTSFTDSYTHINWGWDGQYNGYYLENVFTMDGIKYTTNKKLISNIQVK